MKVTTLLLSMPENIYMSENNWLLFGTVVTFLFCLCIAFGKHDD